MSIRKISAIFKKQIKDTFKNKGVLVQFIMFPLMAVIMEGTIKIENMPKGYFVLLFATMFIGMSPLISMAAIISEEKEKNTLPMLMMSNVKASEYLIGVGSYLYLICSIGTCIFGVVGGYKDADFARFFGIMSVGILIAIAIGAVIGLLCKNQMAETSISVPVMIIFSFLPMISMFNETIGKVSRFTYSQQINNLISSIRGEAVGIESIIILGINLVVVVGLFGVAYRRREIG
ncbi:ABC transporter permease [Alloiococcus sp. CFN-8]|uniref:ABC transporter permease n=1 Tax=Alloiococcus sp. CFN-8 TaxID=3416081 RepID=UPI003CF3E5DF